MSPHSVVLVYSVQSLQNFSNDHFWLGLFRKPPFNVKDFFYQELILELSHCVNVCRTTGSENGRMIGDKDYSLFCSFWLSLVWALLWIQSPQEKISIHKVVFGIRKPKCFFLLCTVLMIYCMYIWPNEQYKGPFVLRQCSVSIRDWQIQLQNQKKVS